MVACKFKIKKHCELCGIEFQALTVNSKYCSAKCSSKAYKQRVLKDRVDKAQEESYQNSIKDIANQPILKIADVAKLMGLTPQTIYNLIYEGKLKAARVSKRLTLVRREDIEEMLANHPYEKRKSVKPIILSDFYRTKEIIKKFTMTRSSVFRMCRRENIPKMAHKGITYWSKKHIDEYFDKNRISNTITDWYSVNDIIENYNMTKKSIYSFISEHSIPKKKIGNESFYSKKHFDEAKFPSPKGSTKFYTAKEVQEKYSITKDQLYAYIKRYNIPKKKEGKFLKISKVHIDDLLSSNKEL